MKLKIFILAVAAVAAFCVGIWLFISPSLNRQSDLEQQGELLDSISAAIERHGVSDDADISHGTDICNEETESEAAYEPPAGPIYTLLPYEPIYEPVPTPPLVPLDPASFPNGITPLGILTIDSIDLRLPVMEGMDEAALRIAPGRVSQTAAIGETGNAVIAGHRNFTFGSMFNRLDEVEIGNIVEFQAMDGAVTFYEVFEVLVILPENQIAFVQPKNEAIITLYTCTPIRGATHRLIVRAVKIEGGF